MMVKKRQAIPEIRFRPPVGTPAGVEVMSLSSLRARVDADRLRLPQRPSFHHLITSNAGTLRHTIDFSTYDAVPGAWLWVRPGQVHQWSNLTKVDGTLILFEQDFLDPPTAAAAKLDDPHAPVLLRPGPDDAQELGELAVHLTRTFAAPERLPVDIHRAVLRHLLAALVLRLSQLPASRERAALDEAFVRFRASVERDFTRTRTVADYARALGYSARTLSRATVAATGLNAKEFIDRRVVLEAKRLLAHSEQPAAQIAARLGFTSATNFTKYFHQRTASTPIAFRATVRTE
jgi:AraC-like DNA-binding protein